MHGSSFSNEPITEAYFKRMLWTALREPTEGKRRQQVRAVLGNFGADVGLSLNDVEGILTKGVTHAIETIKELQMPVLRGEAG